MTWRHVPDAPRCAVGSRAVEAQGGAQGDAPDAAADGHAELPVEAPVEAPVETPAEASVAAVADRGAMPPWWTPWAGLSRGGKLRRGLAIGFFTWHVVAMVAMGASPPIRRVASAVFGFYGERMKMTNTWGMFSKRPSSTHVRVEAVDARGGVHLLATTEAHGKGVLERFRDARLRKIQTKLGVKKSRDRFGAAYLDGWCRVEATHIPDVRETRAVQVLHELRDDRGKVTREAEEKVVLRRSCGPARGRTLPVTDDQAESDEGDDP